MTTFDERCINGYSAEQAWYEDEDLYEGYVLPGDEDERYDWSEGDQEFYEVYTEEDWLEDIPF